MELTCAAHRFAPQLVAPLLGASQHSATQSNVISQGTTMLAKTRNKTRSMFERSAETERLIDILRGVNDEISYANASRLAGFAIHGGTPALTSARRHLETQHGIVFDCVRGVGLRRLGDVEKVTSTARHARSIRRTAKRGTTRIGAIENFAALPLKEQLQATLRATQFEFARQAVSAKQVEAPPDVKPGRLDVKALVAGAVGRS